MKKLGLTQDHSINKYWSQDLGPDKMELEAVQGTTFKGILLINSPLLRICLCVEN